MIPLIPPPSMLRTVIWFPKVGGWMGDLKVWIWEIEEFKGIAEPRSGRVRGV
jgi:hypothetical protein